VPQARLVLLPLTPVIPGVLGELRKGGMALRRWEYRMVRLHETEREERETLLNPLGQECWELVAVTSRTPWPGPIKMALAEFELLGKQHADCEGSLGWDSTIRLSQEGSATL
jgi:hypothetical protein